MASKGHLSFLLLSVIVASLVGSSAGVFHIVGAGKGWRIAPTKTYYEDWARTRDIHVGDKLSKLPSFFHNFYSAFVHVHLSMQRPRIMLTPQIIGVDLLMSSSALCSVLGVKFPGAWV